MDLCEVSRTHPGPGLSARSLGRKRLADPQKQRCRPSGNLAAAQNCVCDGNGQPCRPGACRRPGLGEPLGPGGRDAVLAAGPRGSQFLLTWNGRRGMDARGPWLPGPLRGRRGRGSGRSPLQAALGSGHLCQEVGTYVWGPRGLIPRRRGSGSSARPPGPVDASRRCGWVWHLHASVSQCGPLPPGGCQPGC